MSKIIKVGDVVMWRGCFGTHPPLSAQIKSIELGTVKRSKHGAPVPAVSEELKDFCVFSLHNGHWAYGSQIDTVTNNSDNENQVQRNPSE